MTGKATVMKTARRSRAITMDKMRAPMRRGLMLAMSAGIAGAMVLLLTLFQAAPAKAAFADLDAGQDAGQETNPGSTTDASASDDSAGLSAGSLIAFEPCHVDGVESLARCGTLDVPENYDAPDGKSISLNIAILPPSGGQPTNEPLYFLAGGPGQAATELGQFFEYLLRRARRGRETVLIDQRGTGSSEPFECRFPDNPLADGREVATACLEGVEQDTTQYTTDIFVRDLNEVRKALGHPTISIMGVSYGTRAALRYAHAHEDHVRAMVLDSVAPPNASIFTDESRFASDVLEKTIQACTDEPDCAGAFPDLRADFNALLQRLGEEAAPVILPDADGITISVNRDLFLLGMRGALYAPFSARLIPMIVTEANQGNFGPWSAIADFGGQELSEGIALGLMLSVQCAEEISRITANAQEQAFTVFPSSYALFWKDACAVWPAAQIDDRFWEPVSVATPTLLLSGGLDPVTPPELGDLAAASLSNSRHLVVPYAGHSVISYGCAPKVVGDFLETANPQDLDAACLDKVSGPAFPIGLFGPKP